MHRKKQAQKMSRASDTRALTAKRNVAVLVALAAERRLEKAGHTIATLSAERRSVRLRDSKGDLRNGNGIFIWQGRQGRRRGRVIGRSAGWRGR